MWCTWRGGSCGTSCRVSESAERPRRCCARTRGPAMFASCNTSCGQPGSMRCAPSVPSISQDTSITGPLPQRRVPPAPVRCLRSSIGSLPCGRGRCATRRRCRARRCNAPSTTWSRQACSGGSATGEARGTHGQIPTQVYSSASGTHPAPGRGGGPDHAAQVRQHDFWYPSARPVAISANSSSVTT